MNIRRLSIKDTLQLLTTVNGAFADYIVPFQLDMTQLQSKIAAEQICLDWSAGVFENDQLISFIMHGVRNIDGKITVYNAGTGVLPAFRGQGLISKMYAFLAPFLKENEVQRMVLEVIESNQPAIRAYEKNGFSVHRKLLCFSGNISTAETADVVIRNLENVSWKTLQSFWDIQPTWQSEVQAMDVIKPTIAGAFLDNELIGYASFHPANKRIYQLAVSRSHRRKGIGSALFAEINRKVSSEKVQINNIHETAEHMKLFLEKLGLTNTINQLEMVK